MHEEQEQKERRQKEQVRKGRQEKSAVIKHNIWQTLVSLDQLINCLFWTLVSILVRPENCQSRKAWADEPLSSRCWRLSLAGKDWPRKIIDGLFLIFGEKDHCRDAYESERLGRQLPPELRKG